MESKVDKHIKERGIIFNGEMVRAILDGRKTQTRRVIKNCTVGRDEISPFIKIGNFSGHYPDDLPEVIKNCCPFGQVGERLYVREAWGVVSHSFDDDGLMTDWIPDRPAKAIHEMPYGRGYYNGHAIYAADGDFTWGDDDGGGDGRSCWNPSIHMPKAASRITLEITDIRVERLNDISEEDAKAEGAPTECCVIGDKHFLGFRSLWKSIYGEDSWQSNPFVWVISLRKLEAA